MKNRSASQFVTALAAYLAVVQNRVNELNVGETARTYPDIVRVKQGTRFVGVFTQNRNSLDGSLTGEPKIHSFVDKVGGNHAGAVNEQGAVLYPTSELAPAKHERGNIFNDDHGLSALAPDSVKIRELPRGRTGGGRGSVFIDASDLTALSDTISIPEPETAAATA